MVMPIDDECGEYVAPARQYLDNLVVNHPELGQCELWQAIAWDTAKLRNSMTRADSASDVDEAGREAPYQTAPPLVADAIAQAEADLAGRIMDLIDALNQRMTKLECAADEEERRAKAEQALALAEDIAENAPKALLSALSDRITSDRRLH
jgi:hypothetical protein